MRDLDPITAEYIRVQFRADGIRTLEFLETAKALIESDLVLPRKAESVAYALREALQSPLRTQQSAVRAGEWSNLSRAVTAAKNAYVEAKELAVGGEDEALANVPARLGSFREAPAVVQTVTMMLLRERIERRASGNAAPASSALVASLATAATLIGALLLSFLNRFFGQIGQGSHLTAAEVTSAVPGTVGPVGWFAVALVLIDLYILHSARKRDRERVMATAWLTVYEAGARTSR